MLIDSNNVNIEVSPLSGFIPANGGLELLISVHPVTSCSFDIDLTVAIREASSINVKVTGLAELPNLFVEQVCALILRLIGLILITCNRKFLTLEEYCVVPVKVCPTQ